MNSKLQHNTRFRDKLKNLTQLHTGYHAPVLWLKIYFCHLTSWTTDRLRWVSHRCFNLIFWSNFLSELRGCLPKSVPLEHSCKCCTAQISAGNRARVAFRYKTWLTGERVSLAFRDTEVTHVVSRWSEIWRFVPGLTVSFDPLFIP